MPILIPNKATKAIYSATPISVDFSFPKLGSGS